MRIEPREPSGREVRPAGGSRDPAGGLRAARPGEAPAQIDPSTLLPRSIARSQSVVAGLRQMRSALERGESVDVDALVAAVRFDGEAVLGAHERELRQIAGGGDGGRLTRLIENTEANTLALLSQSGVDVPQRLLADADRPAEMRALLERIVAELGSRAAQVSRLRPERVIELLR